MNWIRREKEKRRTELNIFEGGLDLDHRVQRRRKQVLGFQRVESSPPFMESEIVRVYLEEIKGFGMSAKFKSARSWHHQVAVQ